MKIIFLPFKMIWILISTLIEMVGRMVGGILGLTLILVGAVCTLTIIGAVVGIPLIIFGSLITIRSLF